MAIVSAEVVNKFEAEEHNRHVYQPGDTYPAKGYTIDEERVYFLTRVHPKYKKIYLANVVDDSSNEIKKVDDGEDYPRHTGGGYYELSNGSKVKGKDEAIKVENALKHGD